MKGILKFIAEGFALLLGCLLLAAVIVLPIEWFSSYHEAKAYERVTGKKVSTWDAMFLELRVTAE